MFQQEPSPDVELRRYQLMQGLRKRYQDLCREVLLVEEPRDSLDRWLFEQLALPNGGQGDPLIPKPRLAETSCVLSRELCAEVPMRGHRRLWGQVAFERTKEYCKKAHKWLENFKTLKVAISEEKLQELRDEVAQLEKWIAEHEHRGKPRRPPPQGCPYGMKLNELTGEEGLSSRFHPYLEDRVQRIIKDLSDEAERVVEELRNMKPDDTGDWSVELVDFQEGGSSSSGPPAARLLLKVKDEEKDVLELSGLHQVKLRALYEVHNPRPTDSAAENEWESLFRRRLYVLLRRYVTFIGIDTSEKGVVGGNMHAAAPESVFGWLRKELEVNRELFASPLNCYFSTYHSAFPDSDAVFGSLGSVFDLQELPSGSYEVGPPYTEEVITLTVNLLLRLLREANQTGKALSFALFVPDWGDEFKAYQMLAGPDFELYMPTVFRKREACFALAGGFGHDYISGVQFFPDSGADVDRRYFEVRHGTRVYVLQSPEGAERWPFTEATEQQLLVHMRLPELR